MSSLPRKKSIVEKSFAISLRSNLSRENDPLRDEYYISIRRAEPQCRGGPSVQWPMRRAATPRAMHGRRPRATRSAGGNQIRGDRGPRQQPTAEGLGVTDRPLRYRGRGQCLSFEDLGRRAQPVLHQADAVLELGRPRLSPQRHLGDAMVKGLQHALAHPLVAAEEVRRGGQGLRTGTGAYGGQRVLQIDDLDAEDL